MESYLNEDDYQIILKRRFKTSSVQFTSADIAPLSNSIEGFMGSYFILTIKYTVNNETNEERFFLKTIPQRGATVADMAKQRNVYEKEIFFYDFLQREFEKLGLDITYAPKCFYCKDKSALVMENLPDRGYKLVKKFEFWDLEHCKAGLTALAKFNACSLVYEEKLNIKFGEKYSDIVKENYFPIDEKSFGYSVHKNNVANIKYLSEILGFDDSKKEKIMEELNKLKIAQLLSENSYRKCLGHGDFWFNNIFFHYENSKLSKCCLIDYQTLRYVPPAFDVLLFVYLNTTSKFRTSNLSYLLKYYYESLSDIVTSHGCDMSLILSKDEFQKSISTVYSAAIFNVWMINAFVLMPNDILTELCNEVDQFEDWTELSKIAFSRAIDSADVFKTLLMENLDDLYNSWTEENVFEF